MDSFVVDACGFERVGKWFAESMQHYVILQNDLT